jgi:hypothetical protein
MSTAIAALIAHAAFWALLVCGWWLGEIRARATAVFLTLWIAGYAYCQLLPRVRELFAPFVAILAIALVFKIFKGDVRL